VAEQFVVQDSYLQYNEFS